ncbi:TPA: transposase [Yersinia enterocolitica]|nr:transposase [Yersinia enterocolitica]HEN3379999.1 transposase [Yersinia enterocolitica]HEN3448329.1 transposase [Yersinia enterocolitica]HEN3528528.1 transposase [Yersinia enterocolitica]HEN3593830.1 transposase [Yersinia enterocolitica]
MFLSVNELIGLPGMPGTAPGVRAALNKRAGNSLDLKRKRAGTKAFEYHIDCLTAQQQEVIRERHLNSLLSAEKKAVKTAVNGDLNPRVKAKHELDLMRQCPALLERSTGNLTKLQRDIADARATLVAEVINLQNAGLSRIRAINYICDQSQSNTLPEKLQKAAAIANARKGLRTGVSTRTLNGWVVDYQRASTPSERLVLLAPGHNKGKPIEHIKWMPLFMAHYRTTNGLSIAEAYENFEGDWQAQYADQPAMLAAIPSVYAVRRALDKLPTIVKQRGRVTGSAMRALNTYVKRDWSQMPVNGVWIGDGHSMKMKVAHPDHGRPFTPEITLVIDGRTRYVVGWSLSLAENVIAVADALRHGMQNHGIPLIYYSDNGAGQTANVLDADITGILSRLGVEHPTGIPGNPQARGIIERLNREIPARIARKFATYNGKSADRETVRMVSVDLNSAFNAQGKNKELNSRQKAAMAKLPSWQQLIDTIEDEIEAYNTTHRHSELPRREDGKHYTATEYRQLLLATENVDRLSDIELRDMFRPQVKRTAQRGWLSIFNNQYFAESLIQVDGEDVLVEFDIHDASSVTVRRLDGSFICTAIVNGNTRAAFPVDYIQKVAKDRHSRRMKLVEQKAEEINAELNPVLTAESAPDFGSLIQGDISRINDDREEMFLFQSDRDEYLKTHGNKKAAI